LQSVQSLGVVPLRRLASAVAMPLEALSLNLLDHRAAAALWR
jgi:hypothetical protein